ncbi:MAG: sensor of ECF-type sigma factor [Bacteroidota bacterium]
MKPIQLLSLILFISATAFAQPGSRIKERLQQKKDNVKAMKIAFITTELDLTPDEATKFWPLFNAFEDKQREIKKDRIKNYMDRIDANDKLTEKEASVLVTQMESTEDELYQLRKKFITSLKGVLPATKILKLRKAEEEFSKRLLQQYRDKKMGR